MKNAKTVLAVVMALVMALSMAACGSAEPAPTKAETTATQAPEAQTEAQTEAPAGNETEEVPSVTQEDVPSVTQKDVPSVTQDGVALNGSFVIREMAGETVDLVNDKVVVEVPAEALHVTGFGARNEASEEVRTALENAYNAIVEAKDLTVLSEDVAAAAEAYKLAVEELAVRELMDITLDEEYNKILAEEKNYIVLTFGLDMPEDEAVFVLHCLEDGTWETVFGEDIIREEDGQVSVVLHSLSPVAIVVKSAE